MGKAANELFRSTLQTLRAFKSFDMVQYAGQNCITYEIGRGDRRESVRERGLLVNKLSSNTCTKRRQNV